MTAHPLSEGVFTIGHDKQFVPFDLSLHKLEERPVGSLLVEIQPFLVKARNHHMILDTGLGFRNQEGVLQIEANLKTLGLERRDISKVLLSHLHKDHAGGISFTNEIGVEELCFPNATYYVSRNEFDYALEKGLPSYHPDDFAILAQHPQVEWLDEAGVIDGFISYHTSGGHCPYHVCFVMEEDRQTLFFGGDVVPQLKQLKTRYVAKYDYDGRLSMHRRQEYAELGRANQWQFLFYHDVHTPMSVLS